MDKSKKFPLEFWNASKKAENDLNRAKNRLQPKTYYTKYLGIRAIAVFFARALPSLSVATGALYLAGVFNLLLPYFTLCLIVAAAFIFAWELGKNKLITIAFEGYYTNNSINWGVASLCLAFGVVSASLSLNGVQEAIEQFDNSANLITQEFDSKIQSTESKFDTLIQAEKDSLVAYKNSVKWQGRIDVSNKATSQTINTHQSEISRLQNESSGDIAELKKEKKAALSKVKSDNKVKTIYLIGFAALIEILIVFSGWYPICFDSKIRDEHDTIVDNLSKTPANLTFGDLKGYLQHVVVPTILTEMGTNHSTNANANLTKRRKIGFEQTDSPTNEAVSIEEFEPSSDADYLLKHINVVNAIMNGLKEAEVIETTGIGRTTYYNIKRIIKSINNHKS